MMVTSRVKFQKLTYQLIACFISLKSTQIFCMPGQNVRVKNPESFEKIHNKDFEIFRIFYVTPVPGRDCSNPLTRNQCTILLHNECLLKWLFHENYASNIPLWGKGTGQGGHNFRVFGPKSLNLDQSSWNLAGGSKISLGIRPVLQNMSKSATEEPQYGLSCW